jgi:hypothetical protein
MPSGLVALLVSHLKSALDFVAKEALSTATPRCVAFQQDVGIELARSNVVNICSCIGTMIPVRAFASRAAFAASRRHDRCTPDSCRHAASPKLAELGHKLPFANSFQMAPDCLGGGAIRSVVRGTCLLLSAGAISLRLRPMPMQRLAGRLARLK